MTTVIDDLLGTVPPAERPGVTISEVAEWIGLSERQIARHATEGNVIKLGRNRYDLKASVRAYCAWMRDQAGHYAPGSAGTREGPPAGSAKARLAEERERLVREQADAQALKNAQLRAELVPASEVEREWADVLRTVRASMLAVPSRIAARLAHLSADDVSVIDREVREALTDTAEGGGDA